MCLQSDELGSAAPLHGLSPHLPLSAHAPKNVRFVYVLSGGSDPLGVGEAPMRFCQGSNSSRRRNAATRSRTRGAGGAETEIEQSVDRFLP